MPYIPATEAQRGEMLRVIGKKVVAELFADIPEKFRFPKLNLPDGLSEQEVLDELSALADNNLSPSFVPQLQSQLMCLCEKKERVGWFLGAGAYNHFIPSAVGALAGRGEFLTAYTPYQPEVSQGTLQAIFEYQSMVAELFGVEVVNAGHYDGATALAEAAIIALKNSGGEKHRVLLPETLHPEYLQVLKTYLAAFNPIFEFYPLCLCEKIPSDTSCVVASYPDFYGTIPDLSGIADKVHNAGALFIVACDPLMLGLLKSPGELGADIVAAEGQALGNDMNFGGPFLGIMGATKALMRKIPGRIVGQAADAEGRRGFVLTLSAREQHIRREKAVSNICSNQGLSMLRSCIYLALMGKSGLRAVAELCWNKAHYAAAQIAAIPGFALLNEGTFFNEFLVKCPCDAEALFEKLLAEKNIVPGLPLSRYYPERKNELLICVTEKNTKPDIDELIQCLKNISHGDTEAQR